MAIRALCSVDGCGKPGRTLGYCGTHYLRVWRTGEAGGLIPRRGGPMAWIRAHVTHEGEDCLTWPFQRNNAGYATVSVKGKKRSAARIMCRLKNGTPSDPSLDTAHSCGNGHLACMNSEHLRWATVTENMHDAIEHGTTTRGVKNAQASLTEADVRAIRSLKDKKLYREIASMFGVTPSAVGLIMRRERWAWLE